MICKLRQTDKHIHTHIHTYIYGPLSVKILLLPDVILVINLTKNFLLQNLPPTLGRRVKNCQIFQINFSWCFHKLCVNCICKKCVQTV